MRISTFLILAATCLLTGSLSLAGVGEENLKSNPTKQPLPFRDSNNRWGFCTPFSTEKGQMWTNNYSLGQGTIVIAAQYKWVGFFSEGFARVSEVGTFPAHGPIFEGGRWGFIDHKGKRITPLKYIEVTDFRGGYARVKSSEGWGLIDKSGEIVISAKYNYIDLAFCNDRILIQTNFGWGFCNRKNKEVIPSRYLMASAFRDGMARVLKGNDLAWIDLNGKEYALGKYERIAGFSEGFAAFRRNGKRGYVDKSIQEVLSPKWDKAGPFSNGLAYVKLKGKHGYIDRTGVLVIAPKYAMATTFDKFGMAMVYEGKQRDFAGRTGNSEQGYKFINPKGENVFGRGFNRAYGFNRSKICVVYIEGEWKHLHRDGRLEKAISSGNWLQSRSSIRNFPIDSFGPCWPEPTDVTIKFYD